MCGGDPTLGADPWYKRSVFSTCVEVIPNPAFIKFANLSILHVCGGDPISEKQLKALEEYSPRVWRWSQTTMGKPTWEIVFSTCVEVILLHIFFVFFNGSILHVCGGDPSAVDVLIAKF